MKKIEQLYQYFLKSSGVTTDTREEVKNKIFFALSGENFDGNKFAGQAIEKGAHIAVVDNPEIQENDNYFKVESVLETLQQLALFHRKQFDIPVISITGTNGKTTTKELIASVLSSKFNIIATRGNLNNHIGVPLTLLRITKKTDVAIVEMGANHKGEIAFLTNIALPTHGLITNIGKAHLEGFGNYEGVIKTKNELFEFIKTNRGTVFVNADDLLLMELSKEISRYTYGKNHAEVTGNLINQVPFLSVKINSSENSYEISSKLYGSYNFPNILAAVAAGSFFGVPPKSIQESIENYVPKNNRSQLIQTDFNTIILDAYNANPVSLSTAIKSFQEAGFKNPYLIIGDMFELGKAAPEEHQKIIDILTEAGFNDVILAGKEFQQTNHSFKSFVQTTEVINYLKKFPVRNKTILIKGSNGMNLNSITKYL